MALREEAAANSALWAAYGDALGWISELTDSRGLERRTKGAGLSDLVEWPRRIGGKTGVAVDLPRGTYSDDTQLRLAVCRAIGPAGFDVEAFSRVELTVWLSYALGAGIGTKAAAAHMARPGARWSVNMPAGYENGGGNGAAMRVQPHAWKPSRSTPALLDEVLRDSVTTHGHPRGILGACLHALTLADLMPGELNKYARDGFRRAWHDSVGQLWQVVSAVERDPELSSYWLPAWEKLSERSWQGAVEETLEEIGLDLELMIDAVTGSDSFKTGYDRIINALGLISPEHRGSGTRTVIAAMGVLALIHRHDMDPHAAIRIVVNKLGTDTDSIASMAGAYIGAIDAKRPPPSPPMDWRLIMDEATRVAKGAEIPGPVRYPDLLTWEPPRAQADALANDDGRLVVTGLGLVEELAQPVWSARRDFAWQMVKTSFGQTLLVKRRPELPDVTVAPISLGERVESDVILGDLKRPVTRAPRGQQEAFIEIGSTPRQRTGRRSSEADSNLARALDEAVTEAAESEYDDAVVGRLLNRLARRFGAGAAAAFGSALGAALRSSRRY